MFLDTTKFTTDANHALTNILDYSKAVDGDTVIYPPYCEDPTTWVGRLSDLTCIDSELHQMTIDANGDSELVMHHQTLANVDISEAEVDGLIISLHPYLRFTSDLPLAVLADMEDDDTIVGDKHTVIWVNTQNGIVKVKGAGSDVANGANEGYAAYLEHLSDSLDMGEVIPYSEWAMSAAKTYTDALIKVQAEFLDKLASIPVISEDVNIQSHHEITKATHLYLTEMSDMVMDHTPETEEKLAWKTNALMSVLDEYLLAKFKLVDSAIDVSGYDASYEDIFSEAIYSANLLFWGIDATIYQSLIVKMTNQVNQ
jgi:hypothetical protein